MTRRAPLANLRPFLAELDARLDNLTPDGLKRALRSHARGLARDERLGFLSIFPRTGRNERGLSGGRASVHEGLLSDIESFLDPLAEGEYADDRHPRQERWSSGEAEPSRWASDMAGLFGRADRAFLDGAKEIAAEAYRRLLHVFGDERYLETFGWSDPPEFEPAVELDEIQARFLRSVVDTAGPGEAAARLRDALDELVALGRPAVGLQSVIDADAAPLRDEEAFLEAWERTLEERPFSADSSGIDLNPALRREAARLRGGLDALAALARSEADVRAFVEWSDALLAAGDATSALDAAREGLRRVATGRDRAPVGDRVSRLAEEAGQAREALEAARAAWRSAPTLGRLLRICELGEATAGEVRRRVKVEARRVKELPPMDAQLTAILLVLAGEHDQVLRRVQRLEPLGWSRGGHAGPVLVPFALVAASCPEGPAPDSNLALPWERIDDLERWGDREERVEADELFDDSEQEVVLPVAQARKPRLRLLLLSAAEGVPVARRADYLCAARKACEARVEAIVSARHRGAYQRAATLLVACGEALVLAGRNDAARELVLGVRDRHRRKHAFRREVDEAAARSSVLANTEGAGSESG